MVVNKNYESEENIKIKWNTDQDTTLPIAEVPTKIAFVAEIHFGVKS